MARRALACARCPAIIPVGFIDVSFYRDDYATAG
jgi:pyrimidine operon attenuation protein/uracil phosphoribosyltransferase